jgi:hypothetical protein
MFRIYVHNHHYYHAQEIARSEISVLADVTSNVVYIQKAMGKKYKALHIINS